MARDAGERFNWPVTAGHWALGWSVTTLALVVLAVVVALVRASLLAGEPQATEPAAEIHAVRAALGVVTFFISAALFAIALLAAWPIQATALYLRSNRTSTPIFAAVGVMSSGSAVISYFVYDAIDPLMLLTAPSVEVRIAILIGCYAMHIAILLVARFMAHRRGSVASAAL